MLVCLRTAARGKASRGPAACAPPKLLQYRRARLAFLLLWLALWPLAGRAQILVGATPFGPVFSGLRPAGADTSLLLVARARRVGVSTFVQTSGMRVYLR